MNRKVIVLLVVLLTACSIDKEIVLTPNDCGPLARGELGVVFSAQNSNGQQMYFVEGAAGDICPRLMSAGSVTGFESNYCDNYEPLSKNECDSIKVFTITSLNSLQE
ncbi:hypothetical protein [Kangiella koreensis]|uniref:Lipoprotein n=1 Tax=Kangiella koreensis (strain DSM 16069 / JCM 12317 / KCTC 12182 / SW-125) TaxID=523791 RepID=C7RBK5_KANKD|nr:hypothetical protein [Kangiella koreensis]ACV26647.1 hypothetical protein Kkor_1228 [Kangiella koreensis DSM 16069]